MAIVTEKIPIHKHFLLIDSPVPFDLVLNNGTDECHRPAGAWRIDLYHLLPEKFFKQYPGFTLDIVYDDTNLGGQSVIIRQSDIDLGNGIAGVNGQEVYVTNFNELKKKYKLITDLNDLIDFVSENGIKIDTNTKELPYEFIERYVFNNATIFGNNTFIKKVNVSYWLNAIYLTINDNNLHIGGYSISNASYYDEQITSFGTYDRIILKI